MLDLFLDSIRLASTWWKPALVLWKWILMVKLSFHIQARIYCPPNKLACNGTCVSRRIKCDGIRDCLDGYDEMYCPGNEFNLYSCNPFTLLLSDCTHVQLKHPLPSSNFLLTRLGLPIAFNLKLWKTERKNLFWLQSESKPMLLLLKT